MILVLDNYDSFVFNLARYVRELGLETVVLRNDDLSAAAALALRPQAVLVSPGPCGPNNAGISIPLMRACADHGIPALGVCLGHQALGVAFGGTVRRAATPRHGLPSEIRHDGHPLFTGLGNPFIAARYHSLVVDLPNGGPLRPIAHAEDGELMALAHAELPLWGVQFHPESAITEGGHRLLGNFLTLSGIEIAAEVEA